MNRILNPFDPIPPQPTPREIAIAQMTAAITVDLLVKKFIEFGLLRVVEAQPTPEAQPIQEAQS
jgi:hypothetical protein